jgi:hypothetical protein
MKFCSNVMYNFPHPLHNRPITIHITLIEC